VSVPRGAGPRYATVKIRRMVPVPMWCPRRVSSPWMRRCPQRGYSLRALRTTAEAVDLYGKYVAAMPALLPQLHSVLSLQAQLLDDSDVATKRRKFVAGSGRICLRLTPRTERRRRAGRLSMAIFSVEAPEGSSRGVSLASRCCQREFSRSWSPVGAENRVTASDQRRHRQPTLPVGAENCVTASDHRLCSPLTPLAHPKTRPA
jgi:hypothetical protein